MADHKSTPFPEELKATLGRFRDFLSARKGFSESTITLSVGFVRRMAPELGLNPTHNDITHYVAELRSRGVSYAHATNAMKAIERYSEFLGDPIQLGRPKKPKRILMKTLTEAEVAIFIAATKNLREKAILSLLACSGLRNNELCNLRVRDIDVGKQMVRVHKGKGDRDRAVCVTGSCMEVLIEYMQTRQAGPDDLLFVTARRGLPLEQQDIRKMVRTVAKRAGFTKRIHPHLLRHSLATNLLHRGAHLLMIKEQLGHEYVESTMTYLHATAEELQADYRRFAPSYL